MRRPRFWPTLICQFSWSIRRVSTVSVKLVFAEIADPRLANLTPAWNFAQIASAVSQTGANAWVGAWRLT